MWGGVRDDEPAEAEVFTQEFLVEDRVDGGGAEGFDAGCAMGAGESREGDMGRHHRQRACFDNNTIKFTKSTFPIFKKQQINDNHKILVPIVKPFAGEMFDR